MNRSLLTALGTSAVLVVFFLWQGWTGQPIDGRNVLTVLVIGLAVGATYALYATGLVVVYNTTGIFNFAQGAIGTLSAFLYWELRFNRDWPAPLALIVVIVAFAPLLGIVLDLLLMRRLEGAPLVIQLMVTVGLMLGLLGITANIWQQDTSRTFRPFFGSDGFGLGPTNVTWHRAISVLVALAIAVSLRILFKSRLGIAMRAVVDNRSLAALNGARPAVVSASAWAIGATLAAVAGILIAPGREMDPQNLNLVIVTAFAAAAFGQLKSLPLAFAGAMLIGLAEAFTRQFLFFGGDWPSAVEGIAPIVLFVVVLALPQARLEVGRIATNLRPVERLTRPSEAILGMGLLTVFVIVWVNGGLGFLGVEAWSQEGFSRGNQVLYVGLIVLSLVPLTGWTGQVNFAPLAFAGFGAFVFLKLSGGDGNAAWLLLVPVLCFPLGALVAIPAARLRGLYLALASMAFALAMEKLFFPHPRTLTQAAGSQFGRLRLFGTELDREGLMTTMLVVFGAVIVGLVALRRSRFGRRWVAVNDSQSAAATIGVSLVETKVLVYGLSAAIAGLGGAFMATARTNVDFRDFTLFGGLPFVLLVAMAGVRYPIAGLMAGVNSVLLIIIADKWDIVIFEALEIIGPALLAFTLVVNQRGAIHEIGRGFAPLLPWRQDARDEMAAEKARKREPEIGELGLDRAFTADAVIALDRTLGITDHVTPPGGYASTGPPVIDLTEEGRDATAAR